MATVPVPIDDTAYVLISSADDFLASNTAIFGMRIAFAATLPAVDTTAYHPLDSKVAVVKKAGIPADNLYARMESGAGIMSVS